jgi:hypothetical protein
MGRGRAGAATLATMAVQMTMAAIQAFRSFVMATLEPIGEGCEID